MSLGSRPGLRAAAPGGVHLGHQSPLVARDRPRHDQRGRGRLHRRRRGPHAGHPRASTSGPSRHRATAITAESVSMVQNAVRLAWTSPCFMSRSAVSSSRVRRWLSGSRALRKVPLWMQSQPDATASRSTRPSRRRRLRGRYAEGDKSLRGDDRRPLGPEQAEEHHDRETRNVPAKVSGVEMSPPKT